MEPANIIQIAILAVLTITAIITMFGIFNANTLLKLTIQQHEYNLYFNTYKEITDDHIKTFHAYPIDYVSNDLYQQKYKHASDAQIRKLIYITRTYEQVARQYSTYKISNNISELSALTRWIYYLKKTDEFNEVNDYYREDYPDFHNFTCNISHPHQKTLYTKE